MNFKELSLDQLKSLAYDQTKLAQQVNYNIQVLENEIVKRLKEEAIKEAPTPEVSEESPEGSEKQLGGDINPL